MPVPVDREIENGDDVGVTEPGGGAALAQEALAEDAGVIARRSHDFQGDFVAEQEPLGAIHLAHSAGAKAATNGVAPVEDGADGEHRAILEEIGVRDYAFAITSPFTRSCVTSPLCVTSVSRVISSATSNARAFSLVSRCLRNVVMFFAYIWLA